MRKLIALFVALSLTGCFKVGPDYQKPQVEAPKQWRFADQKARDLSNSQWWEQFKDPALNRLVGQALKNNLDLKIAIANVERFAGLYGSTRANLFPQISGFGQYERRQTSGELINIPGVPFAGKETDFANLGAQMNWELDVWGALRRANEAAFADLLGQQALQKAVILTLVSEVAQAYINLRALDRNLEITRAVVESLEEQLRIARVRFAEGFTSELEVNQVESELERRAAAVPQVEQLIAQTEHALRVLLGQNPGPIERGKPFDELKLPTPPAGLPSELLVRRPDIERAEQALIGANARIGVARGQYFPRISLTGDVGQVSTQLASLFAPGANFWTVGSAMLTPIFTAGKIAGQVQASEADREAALANYRRSIISAFREFEDALIGSQKTAEQREKQTGRVAAVQNYVNLARIRYDEGYTDFITVLDSMRQLYEAQIELLGVANANLTAAVQLYRAMGGGWIVTAQQAAEVPKPPEPSYFP